VQLSSSQLISYSQVRSTQINFNNCLQLVIWLQHKGFAANFCKAFVLPKILQKKLRENGKLNKNLAVTGSIKFRYYIWQSWQVYE